MRAGARRTAAFLIFAAAATARAGGPLDDARAALANGDFAKATEIAGRVPESSKDRPRALCVLGDVALAQQMWDDAEKAFKDALAKKPKFVPAMAGLARALIGEDKADEASRLATEATGIDNRDIGAWQALCAAFVARGDAEHLNGAKTNLEATLKLDAKEPVTNRMYVEVLLKLGKTDDAEKACEQYAKADKDSAMSWFLRGVVHDAKKAPDKAVDAWRKAVKKDDRLRDAHARLAAALAASDPERKDAAKTKEALASAQRYADLGGKDKALLGLLDALKAAAPMPPGK